MTAKTLKIKCEHFPDSLQKEHGLDQSTYTVQIITSGVELFGIALVGTGCVIMCTQENEPDLRYAIANGTPKTEHKSEPLAITRRDYGSSPSFGRFV